MEFFFFYLSMLMILQAVLCEVIISPLNAKLETKCKEVATA
jgi:hypothetical protein